MVAVQQAIGPVHVCQGHDFAIRRDRQSRRMSGDLPKARSKVCWKWRRMVEP